jgi:hypothetical protein
MWREVKYEHGAYTYLYINKYKQGEEANLQGYIWQIQFFAKITKTE